MLRAITVLVVLALASTIVAACDPTPTTPDTSLTGTAAHTGTLTILRVDDGWRGDAASRRSYKLGDGLGNRGPRFVPVRGKNDVAPFDTPDRRVTSADFVTISLNSAFIKYFKESVLAASTGEIAMVLSFTAGSTVKENILVVSSRGQTYGSFLDVQDWPVIGPVKVDGDSLAVRIVIIELDQVENETMRQFIASAAGFAGTVIPQAGAALKIAQGVTDFIISQNADDVVLDQRFTMQRMDEGTIVNRMPLLFGKYVLVMQEDALASTGAADSAPTTALKVPEPDKMRFDRHFDRLHKTYPYTPDVPPAACEIDLNEVAEEAGVQVVGPYFANLDMGRDVIEWSHFFLQPPLPEGSKRLQEVSPAYEACVFEKVNGEGPTTLRRTELGYEEPYLGNLDLLGDLDRALKVAYLESLRTKSVSGGEAGAFETAAAGFFPDADLSGGINLNYPLIQYPEAYVLLGQYPLHTHVVMSIDRSLGGEGAAFHDQFQDFADFLEEERQTVRDNDRFGTLTTLISQSLRESKNQNAHIRHAAAMPPEGDESEKSLSLRRVCYLWRQALGDGADQILSDGPVYNEIYHLTGFKFVDQGAVVDYLTDRGYIVDTVARTCAAS